MRRIQACLAGSIAVLLWFVSEAISQQRADKAADERRMLGRQAVQRDRWQARSAGKRETPGSQPQREARLLEQERQRVRAEREELAARWPADRALEERLRLGQEAASPVRLPAQQAADGGAAERQAQRQAALQQQERSRLQPLVEQERLRTEQRLAARADAERRERAWARF